ncbi:hypothetical protein L2E82_39040 [Cichorium intybus]|uniref:Uncharacterized protein n=1 Tax=Cichorium intybus TaxID=13427 RepID=A0ACB9AH42_CICIN|nr:hypothetical protein L2E82_39040 [Cichorium intybus]
MLQQLPRVHHLRLTGNSLRYLVNAPPVKKFSKSRKDVEGSLFVVKRNTQPRFQFIVMNRRNTENLCEDVANLFTRILGAYSKVPPKQKVNKSEFEKLEAVPTSAVIEGPLEPGLTNSRSTDVPQDSSFVNFFSTAMNLGHNPSNPVNSIPPYPTPIPLPSRDTPSPIPNNPPLQNPSSVPTIPLHDNSDQFNSTNHVTNLIKPFSFFTPTSSSSAPPPLIRQPSSTIPVTTLQPPLNVQRNIRIPVLQPFPPPTPPPSLTPTSNSSPFHGPLTREKVRDALVMLSQFFGQFK